MIRKADSVLHEVLEQASMMKETRTVVVSVGVRKQGWTINEGAFLGVENSRSHSEGISWVFAAVKIQSIAHPRFCISSHGNFT